MSVYLNWAFVPLWSIVYCVAPDKSSLKLVSMILAWLHVLLALGGLVGLA